MLAKDEIVRRIRALMEIPERERPISIHTLHKLCGLDPMGRELWRVARNGDLGKGLQIRISRGLELLENNQFDIVLLGKNARQGIRVDILDTPRPPVKIENRVQISPDGVKMVRYAYNPLTFPDRKKVDK